MVEWISTTRRATRRAARRAGRGEAREHASPLASVLSGGQRGRVASAASLGRQATHLHTALLCCQHVLRT